jgi:uncharacterized protein YqgV (UPF0045/DUF77 family)
MKITVDISMYPLRENYVPPIKSFIIRLREYPGIEVVTNQLSTQLTGEFDNVTRALNDCISESMAQSGRVVFVARYLNASLDINRMPEIR